MHNPSSTDTGQSLVSSLSKTKDKKKQQITLHGPESKEFWDINANNLHSVSLSENYLGGGGKLPHCPAPFSVEFQQL